MSTTLSIRLPEKMADEIDEVARLTDRPKTYIVRKAIEEYLSEYADYLIALERLNDKDDEIVSSKDMRERLGL